MDEKQKQLLLDNLDLVEEIAEKYAGRGVPLLTLIYAGNRGLMKAVEQYTQTTYEFKGFASWFIRQAIMKEFNGR